MYKNVKAIVLREVRYKEADRILTLYSAEEGKITASAHGALSKKSCLAASTQHLTYSDFVLDYRNGRYSVKEAGIIEQFAILRADYSNYSLACYFAECIEYLCPEETPEETILRLLLNSLYALNHSLYPQEQIKAAFELRLLSELGYSPVLQSCYVCGAETPSFPVFCYENGCVCCRDCRTASLGNGAPLTASALEGMKHIAGSGLKHFLSFSIEKADLASMANATEKYFKFHSGRNFATLDYWMKIRNDVL